MNNSSDHIDLNHNELIQIHSKLIRWFNTYQRILPWRENYHPYKTWISEIMLQQTQVNKVIKYYNHWYTQYPNIQTLQKAQLNDLNTIWQGLGYYSRCANILKTAKILYAQYNNKFPQTKTQLINLPGIGDYTAGAILSIAFQKKEAIVDGNIKRVLSRILQYNEDIKTTKSYSYFKNISNQIVQLGKPRQINQALMELGALICTKKSPKCLICPIKQNCKSYLNKSTDKIPKTFKHLKKTKLKLYFYTLQYENQLLIVKNKNTNWWKNFYGFAYFNNKNNYVIKQIASNIIIQPINRYSYNHYVTKYNLNVNFYLINLSQKIKIKNCEKFMFEWIHANNLFNYPMHSLANKMRMDINYIINKCTL